MRRLLIPILLMIPVLAAGDEPSQRPRLRLAGAEFHPAEKTPPTPKWFQADRVERSPRGRRYVVAIVRESLSPEQRQQLESAGAELLGYLPDRGYRLSAPPAAMNRIRAFPFVEWLGELPAHTKVLPQLARAASRGTESARIRVVLAPTESEQRVLHALGGLAATAAPSGRNGAWRVTATVPSNRLAKTLSAIAALPEVEAVEPVRTIMPLNQDGVWIHQSFVGPSPQQTPIFDRGIFGCGQIVSVADTAQDHDSCYFADDVNGPPPTYSCLAPPCLQEAPDFGQRKDIIYYNWSGNDTGEEDTCPTVLLGGSGHGTHTSGSVAGDNSPYADCDGYTGANRNGGDGQAPGARLVMLELGDGLEYLNDLGGTIWNIADVAYRSGARIHSFSFGGVCHDGLGQCIAGCTLPYDSLSRDADLAMWTYPDLLLVNAAGNAGLFCPPPVSVVTPALAKNLLAVGGVEHGVSSGNVMDESSRGPVFDGRLRPTLAAQGRAVVSAASDASLLSGNCATCSLDGTSMSAPTTAGLAALAREYYTAGFYASGTRNPAQGFTPSGALLKATLLDGAVDIAAPGADVDSGFGRALLGSTLAFSGDPFVLRVDDHSQGITTGSVVNHAFDVSSSEPFRATLVWTRQGQRAQARGDRSRRQRLVPDPRFRDGHADPNDESRRPAGRPQHRRAHHLRQRDRRPLGRSRPGSGRAVGPSTLRTRRSRSFDRLCSARGSGVADPGDARRRTSRDPLDRRSRCTGIQRLPQLRFVSGGAVDSRGHSEYGDGLRRHDRLGRCGLQLPRDLGVGCRWLLRVRALAVRLHGADRRVYAAAGVPRRHDQLQQRYSQLLDYAELGSRDLTLHG
jgi:hypothetical protein